MTVDIGKLEGWLVKEKSRKSMLGWAANRRWFKVEALQGLGGDELALCYYKVQLFVLLPCPQGA